MFESSFRKSLIVKFLHCRTNGREWKRLIDAGINDWGGVSPVTKDWVNPEVSFENRLKFAMIKMCANEVGYWMQEKVNYMQ
jgi:hypothetical protein